MWRGSEDGELRLLFRRFCWEAAEEELEGNQVREHARRFHIHSSLLCSSRVVNYLSTLTARGRELRVQEMSESRERRVK